jgi:hypothetical protein
VHFGHRQLSLRYPHDLTPAQRRDHTHRVALDPMVRRGCSTSGRSGSLSSESGNSSVPEHDVPARRRLSRSGRIVVLATWANLLAAAISYAVMLAKVESVLFSGPLLCIFGAGLLVVARASRCRRVAWAAVGNFAICALLFGLVQLYHWRPLTAYRPFALLGPVYVVALGALQVCVHRHAPRVSPDECRKCGYLLIGLTAPRCPECGTPFDLSQRSGAQQRADGA